MGRMLSCYHRAHGCPNQFAIYVEECQGHEQIEYLQQHNNKGIYLKVCCINGIQVVNPMCKAFELLKNYFSGEEDIEEV